MSALPGVPSLSLRASRGRKSTSAALKDGFPSRTRCFKQQSHHQVVKKWTVGENFKAYSAFLPRSSFRFHIYLLQRAVTNKVVDSPEAGLGRDGARRRDDRREIAVKSAVSPCSLSWRGRRRGCRRGPEQWDSAGREEIPWLSLTIVSGVQVGLQSRPHLLPAV